jgi:hypothetical protein
MLSAITGPEEPGIVDEKKWSGQNDCAVTRCERMDTIRIPRNNYFDLSFAIADVKLLYS